jgi:AAA15 family ATPase/GTPase
MRIKNLYLKDWSVIREAEFNDLENMVIIAGPNGVGKTKIKDVISQIFRSGGNPPPGCRVTLEATSKEELSAWKSKSINLPAPFFQSIFTQSSKRIKTKSKLIQIDANRNVDSVQFNKLTFDQIGDPENEDVSWEYGLNNVQTRFKDICQTLKRLKSREITTVYNAYTKGLASESKSVTLSKVEDPTEKYINLFNQLLHPKIMSPIGIQSSTIQFIDTDGVQRTFNDLSSGEREILILIFDLFTQNPSDSIILIDEPELHLHPELAYRFLSTLAHVGERNQFFLFTHSADIIGSSLDNGVHFLRPKTVIKAGNQVVRIDHENLPKSNLIPNLRETIGMISIGKKIAFVEGNVSSIDRNVFSLLAKSSKVDVAIIPSTGCTNVTNMGLLVEALENGIFGLEFHMIRDRDSLSDEMIEVYKEKSNGRLHFLPFYHIENAFLDPEAIYSVSQNILFDKTPEIEVIRNKLYELAYNQIPYLLSLYVKNEIYFMAGNFDVSSSIRLDSNITLDDLAKDFADKSTERIQYYTNSFTQAEIRKRLEHWDSVLKGSLKNGWSNEARRIVFGKRILKELQSWLFNSKSISLWELIAKSKEPACLAALKELRDIIERI